MNHEHYNDPTADKAIKKIRYEEEKINRTIAAIKHVVWLAGFKVVGRIVLEDKKTGRVCE